MQLASWVPISEESCGLHPRPPSLLPLPIAWQATGAWRAPALSRLPGPCRAPGIALPDRAVTATPCPVWFTGHTGQLTLALSSSPGFSIAWGHPCPLGIPPRTPQLGCKPTPGYEFSPGSESITRYRSTPGCKPSHRALHPITSPFSQAPAPLPFPGCSSPAQCRPVTPSPPAKCRRSPRCQPRPPDTADRSLPPRLPCSASG